MAGGIGWRLRLPDGSTSRPGACSRARERGCLEWGLAGYEEPDTSVEPGGLYDVINVLLASMERQESLGSGPSFVAYPSAMCYFRQHSLSKPQFLVLKMETKMVPSFWRWYGDWVK